MYAREKGRREKFVNLHGNFFIVLLTLLIGIKLLKYFIFIQLQEHLLKQGTNIAGKDLYI